MAYPMPDTINWSNGMQEGFSYLNTVTSSWFSNLLLIAIYILFATGFYFAKRDMFGAMAVAGFSTFVVSLLFFVAGMISGITFAIVIAVAIIGFASLWIGQD